MMIKSAMLLNGLCLAGSTEGMSCCTIPHEVKVKAHSTCFLPSRKIPHMLPRIYQRQRVRAVAEPGTVLIACRHSHLPFSFAPKAEQTHDLFC